MLSKVLVLEWASVYIGALLLENMEGCSFLRAFEIKRYRKILRKQVSFHGGPVGEPVGDSLAWTFREKRIVYLGSFLGPRGH
jgi:hypothetical protein